MKTQKEIRYREYTSKLIPWLKEQIDKSPDKIIRIKVEDVIDVIDKMGTIFKKDINIYSSKKDIHIRALWELKYLLWADGIVVKGGMNKIGEDLLIFRKKTSEDEPPIPNLIEVIGEKEAYYFKKVEANVVTENIFAITDIDIKDKINELDIAEDFGIYIVKFSDWETVKIKESTYYTKNIEIDVVTGDPFIISDEEIIDMINILNIGDVDIFVLKISDGIGLYFYG